MDSRLIELDVWSRHFAYVPFYLKKAIATFDNPVERHHWEIHLYPTRSALTRLMCSALNRLFSSLCGWHHTPFRLFYCARQQGKRYASRHYDSRDGPF